MKTKHTSGPWVVLPEEVDRPYIRIRGTVLGGRYKIANVMTPVYDGADKREAEETRANAHLIKLAPELLAFADRVFRTFYDATHDGSVESSIRDEAKALIAAATGVSHE